MSSLKKPSPTAVQVIKGVVIFVVVAGIAVGAYFLFRYLMGRSETPPSLVINGTIIKKYPDVCGEGKKPPPGVDYWADPDLQCHGFVVQSDVPETHSLWVKDPENFAVGDRVSYSIQAPPPVVLHSAPTVSPESLP